MEIYKHLQKCLQIYENPYNSVKIYEIHEHVWDRLVLKKEMGYILYSKEINASDICPPKRNKLFRQRQEKSWFWGKHGLRHAKHESKSFF